MMKKISVLLMVLGLAWSDGALLGQRTILRKDMKKQDERTAAYSKKSVIFCNLMQVGVLARTATNDSLNTAPGLQAWQYGFGVGWVIPIAGPLCIRPEANYRFRNYRMQKETFAILGQIEQLQRYRLASHAVEFGLNLRLTNSRGGLQQGKYIELGYLYGRNFANRLIYTQTIDPATNMGASSNKNKLKNPDFFARATQYAQLIIGREGLCVFGQYRITDWFVRSKNVYNNQHLPEVSRLTLGIAFLVGNDPPGGNTDENDAPSH